MKFISGFLRVLFGVFIFFGVVFAVENDEIITTGEKTQTDFLKDSKKDQAKERLDELYSQITKLEQTLLSNAILQQYNNYYDYQSYKEQKDEIIEQLKQLKKPSKKKTQLEEKLAIVDENINILKDYENYSFIKNFSVPQTIEIFPKIKNPIHIFAGFSHIKELQYDENRYQKNFQDFGFLVDKLALYLKYQNEITLLEPTLQNKEKKEKILKQFNDFTLAYERASTSLSIYTTKVDGEIKRIGGDIKAQFFKILNIIIGIVIVILFFIFSKKIIKKYVEDNEKIYTMNKILNLIQLCIIILVLLFAYIDNISYFVTVLGFASAGIAIAMRDMFMSILGWFVIIFGGGFKVGDRVKVIKGGVKYVGDIIDISLLKMTIYEEMTLNAMLSREKRAGRIIYAPNNLIFTELIANYTHGNIYTLYDGLDVYVSFDSNLTKLEQILKEIINPITQNATAAAKSSMKQLRAQYNMRYARMETRVIMMLEREGVRVCANYLCFTREALKTRTAIVQKLLAELQKHDDIKLAYPTQMLFFNNDKSTSLYKNMDEKFGENKTIEILE